MDAKKDDSREHDICMRTTTGSQLRTRVFTATMVDAERIFVCMVTLLQSDIPKDQWANVVFTLSDSVPTENTTVAARLRKQSEADRTTAATPQVLSAAEEHEEHSSSHNTKRARLQGQEDAWENPETPDPWARSRASGRSSTSRPKKQGWDSSKATGQWESDEVLDWDTRSNVGGGWDYWGGHGAAGSRSRWG